MKNSISLMIKAAASTSGVRAATSLPSSGYINRDADGLLLATDDDWFDESHGTYRALHSFNRIRIPWMVDYLGELAGAAARGSEMEMGAEEEGSSITGGLPLQGLRILDVGSGGGILSLALCRLGASVVGLEPDAGAAAVARRVSGCLLPPLDYGTNNAERIRFVAESVEQFAESPVGDRFDAVVASEVLEHVADVRAAVSACWRLAKRGAPLFFTTINRTVWSQLFAITLAEDVLGLLPKGLHRHDAFVTPDELRAALLDAGPTRVGHAVGLCYNPLFNLWAWSPPMLGGPLVNYGLVARKLAD